MVLPSSPGSTYRPWAAALNAQPSGELSPDHGEINRVQNVVTKLAGPGEGNTDLLALEQLLDGLAKRIEPRLSALERRLNGLVREIKPLVRRRARRPRHS